MPTNVTGLTTNEANHRLKTSGPNQVFTPYHVTFWGIFKEEVTEPMILLLLVVGSFYSLWGEAGDAITIVIVIIVLTFSEVLNEFRAKRAIASLEKIATPKTKVIRDGKFQEIDTLSVVPGDILVLVVGTKISADAVIESSVDLQVDESSLTGESFPKDKKLSSEVNAGTVVVFGEGLAKVTATGKKTKIGQLAESAKMIKPPKTKLQLAMKVLAGKLLYVAVFFSIAIPLLGIIRGQDIKTMILTGLSLSFAVIPEELPIVITMVLGIGSLTLSRKNFYIKRLKAAETLGGATVIVTDKTGTLTEGTMKLAAVYPNNEDEVISAALMALSEVALDPIDTAVKDRASELKISLDQGSVIVRERSFGAGRASKAMLRTVDKKLILTVSGAPEEIFGLCGQISKEAALFLASETSNGRRVTALAQKEVHQNMLHHSFDELEKDLRLTGIIAFEDPPRSGVKETISKAATAGIRTIMVTGDHPFTAAYIGSKVGIQSKKILTGDDIKKMTDSDLNETVREINIFARALPEDKYRIVKALQHNGEIVAVTGDGINDALALKGADIGIAMGIRGTDVAKEAAQVVLADDNYITIANGIFEGRKFFDNLQKGIKYYLAIKFALVSIFLLPVIIGTPMPLSPIQIIILELFMDLAASIGFVYEPAEKNIYIRRPHDPKTDILGRDQILDIVFKGSLLFLSVSGVYLYTLIWLHDLPLARTLAFSSWIIGHVYLAYIGRSDKDSILSLGFFTNKVIVLWSTAALIFLAIALYLPPVSLRLGMVSVPPLYLLYVLTATVGFISLREIFKKLFPSQVRTM